MNETFELFDRLGANDEQLDFPVVYASALQGWASLDVAAAKAPMRDGASMRPLFETILSRVPAPAGDPSAPLQFQVSALDYSSYLGRLGIGRIRRGRMTPGQDVAVLRGTDVETPIRAKIGQIFEFEGLERTSADVAEAGDKLYEGMVIGIHSRDNDLVVNPIKGKQLTNIRAAGKDEAIALTPPIALTLEYAVEFIADDELCEVTPRSIRIRKRHLKEHERKRAARASASAEEARAVAG